MTVWLINISNMSESYKDKNLKKIYRNGNIAWTSSTDMKSYIPDKITRMVDKKTFLHCRENRFRDVVRTVGQEYGILENYNASMTLHDAIKSNEKFTDNRNALSTRKGFIQQGPKLKDTFISKGRLKWTRLCEILLTVIIVSVCISIVIFQTVQCITKYLARDTSVTEHVKYTTDTMENPSVPFIEFTVCPAYESAYKGDVLNQYGLTKSEYRNKGMFYPRANGTGVDPRSLFLNATHDVKDIFLKIIMKTLSYDIPLFEVDFTNDEDYSKNISISTKYYEHFGRCYSMHPTGEVLKLGVTSMYFITKINIYVYFGYPGQFMYSNTKSKAYSILGQKLYLDFAYEISINTLEDFESMGCDPKMNLNFDETLYSVANSKLEQKFGCTVPFLPPLISNKTDRLTKICGDAKSGTDALELYDYFKSGGLSQISKQPCATMDIFLGLPFTSPHSSDEEAYFKIYLKTAVKVKKTVLDYDYLTMIGEFGGYTGLLLGISAVDILIRFNRLFIRMFSSKNV